MAGGGFSFKRFHIEQDGCAMKVGTDGVLLGAWCTVEPGFRKALDIGTGTGLIAVMLAQRGEGFSLEVDAIEIDEPSGNKARENAGQSEWAEHIAVELVSVQKHKCGEEGIYDLVVSNPPYFNDSLLPPDASRTNARHTTTLTHSELVGNVTRLIKPDGVFAVILPYPQADDFISLASREGLRLSRRTDVFPTPRSQAKRSLLEFRKVSERDVTGGVCESGTLVIENAPLDYTSEYMELTRDFYLKF